MQLQLLSWPTPCAPWPLSLLTLYLAQPMCSMASFAIAAQAPYYAARVRRRAPRTRVGPHELLPRRVGEGRPLARPLPASRAAKRASRHSRQRPAARTARLPPHAASSPLLLCLLTRVLLPWQTGPTSHPAHLPRERRIRRVVRHLGHLSADAELLTRCRKVPAHLHAPYSRLKQVVELHTAGIARSRAVPQHVLRQYRPGTSSRNAHP
jgi:hypothetical protein